MRGKRRERESHRSCKRRERGKREEAPAGTGTNADVVVVGDVASSTESVSDPSGPAAFRSGSTGACGGGPNAIAFNCESSRNCRTNYATPKVAKNFLANDQNGEKARRSCEGRGKKVGRGVRAGGETVTECRTNYSANCFKMISI